jgi:hypothetical protein
MEIMGWEYRRISQEIKFGCIMPLLRRAQRIAPGVMHYFFRLRKIAVRFLTGHAPVNGL